MSTLSQFVGGMRATTSIQNQHSAGGVSQVNVGGGAAHAVNALAGATTAGVLKTVLSVTGRSEVPYLGAYSANATSRTIRLRVTVDGVVVFDATSNAIAVQNNGVLACGQYNGTACMHGTVPIRALSSLVVEIASSLTETNGVGLAYVVHGA